MKTQPCSNSIATSASLPLAPVPVACTGLALLVAALLLGEPAMAYEEPAYTVVKAADDYELRRYEGYIVAETDVTGGIREAGGKAFRILAGYIFGNNTASEKMQMTVPVESRAADAGVKMAMTAPVFSAESDAPAAQQTYAFVMEHKYSLDTLPAPNDSRVRLREIAPRTVAVRRFSGFWSEANFGENESELLGALAADGIAVTSGPVIARYNGPITPWFLRRNEVLVEVDWPAGGGATAATAAP